MFGMTDPQWWPLESLDVIDITPYDAIPLLSLRGRQGNAFERTIQPPCCTVIEESPSLRPKGKKCPVYIV